MRIFDIIRENLVENYEENKYMVLEMLSKEGFKNIAEELNSSFYSEYKNHKNDLITTIDFYEREMKKLQLINQDINEKTLLEKEGELVGEFTKAIVKEWLYFKTALKGQDKWFMKKEIDFSERGADSLSQLTSMVNMINQEKENIDNNSIIVNYLRAREIIETIISKIGDLYEVIDQDLKEKEKEKGEGIDYANKLLEVIGNYLNVKSEKKSKLLKYITTEQKKIEQKEKLSSLLKEEITNLNSIFLNCKGSLTLTILNEMRENIQNGLNENILVKNMNLLSKKISSNEIQLNYDNEYGHQDKLINDMAYIITDAIKREQLSITEFDEWFENTFKYIMFEMNKGRGSDRESSLGWGGSAMEDGIDIIIKKEIYRSLYQSGKLKIDELVSEQSKIKYEKCITLDKTLCNMILKYNVADLEDALTLKDDFKISFNSVNNNKDITITIITKEELNLTNEDIFLIIKGHIELEKQKRAEIKKVILMKEGRKIRQLNMESLSMNIIRELELKNKLLNMEKNEPNIKKQNKI